MRTFIGLIVFCATALAQTEVAKTEAAPTAIEGTSVAASDRIPEYSPITGNDRVRWVVGGTLGIPNLAGHLIGAGLFTGTDSPREYGPHWEGFGKRYGMAVASGATGRVLEAGIGSFWGEDPRYDRAEGQPFKNRLGHVFKMTVMSRNRDGHIMPAYARYIAVPGNSFLSNTWRADSEATTDAALMRVPTAFLNQLVGNAFSEFWPDVRRRLSKSKGP